MKKTKLRIVFLAMLFTGTVFAQQRGYYDAPYTRYEADIATGNGTVVNSTDQNNIAFEASERKVVKLTNGQSRTFTATAAFRGVVVRASGATGETTTSGTNVSVDVTAGGTTKTLTFDASYGWKNLQADGNENYNGVSNSNRRMRYDEQRCLFDNTIASGQTITVTSKSNNVYLDFIEAEDVPAAIACPAGYTQYPGSGDLKSFIENTPNPYIPAGNYTISNYVDAGTGSKIIRGAGKWYTNITFSGNQAGFVGHSTSCGIRDMYLNCTNKSRSNSNKGIRGVWGTVTDMWVEHFECGMWVGNYDGGYGAANANGMQVTNCRFRSNYADGINFCRGTVNSKASHCSFRSNGDDDMAVWPADGMNCTNNTFEYNTAEHCWFASSCACYGGSGNKWQYIIVRDNWEPGLRSNTTFPGVGFTGQNLMSNIDVIRCGTNNNAYGAGTAAIDLQGGANIRLECIDISGSLGNDWHNGASNGTMCGVTGAANNGTCNCSTITITAVNITGCPGAALNQGGVTAQLSATVTGTGGTIPQTVTWTTSDAAKATVDNTGKVTTGNTTGSVTITATSTADNSKTKTCTFTVQAIPVTGVTLTASKTAMFVGDTYTFTASVQPNTVNQAVTWSSNDPTVASIGTDGKVTALKAGTTTIKATSVQDNTKSVQITLTVSNVAVTSVTLADATVAVGSQLTLAAVVAPTNATNKTVTYSIVNQTPANAITLNNGVVTGVATGTATVRATTQDGNKTDDAIITVTNCPAGNYDLIVEDLTWTPEYPQINDKVVFTATIKNQGGTATPDNQKHGISFTVNSQDGNTFYTATWNDQYNTSIPGCTSVTLTATGGRTDAPASNYITGDNGWKPAANGTYQVVAFVADNGYVADNETNRTNNTLTKNIIVGQAPPAVSVTGVSFTQGTHNIEVNEQVVLANFVSVAPANATNKAVTYSIVSGDTYINLAANGTVTGRAAGQATVRVSTTDGGFTAQATINVTAPILPSCGGNIIVKTATVPTIDGTIDVVWANAPTNPISQQVAGTGKGGNLAGFSAQWRAMYDNTYLYALVEVTKPTAYTGFYSKDGNWWEGSDAVELMFDADNNGANDGDARHLIFRYNAAVLAGANSTDGNDNVTASSSSNGNTWLVETRIPLTNLSITAPTAELVIGFQAAVNVVESTAASGRIAYYTSFATTDPPPAKVNIEMPMEKVMDLFESTNAWNLPVIDENEKYLGFVSKSKIFNSYRNVLVHFSDE